METPRESPELMRRLIFYKKGRWVLLAMDVVVGLCLAVVLPKFKDDLIIRYHLSGWRTLRTFGYVLLAAIFFFVGATSYKVGSLKRRLGLSRRPTPKKPAKTAKTTAQDLDTPEGLYARMEELQSKAKASGNRAFLETVNDILDDLDEMNRLQESFENLSRQNDIDALSQLRRLLQDIEDSICRKLKLKLLNYHLIEGDEGFVERAPAVLDVAHELLSSAKQLLLEVAHFIEQGDTDIIADKVMEYQAMIKQFSEEDDEHGNFDDFGQTAQTGTPQIGATPQAETQPGRPETGVLADTAEMRDVAAASHSSGVAALWMHGD